MAAVAYYYKGDRRPTFQMTLEREGQELDVSGATEVRLLMWELGKVGTDAPVLSGVCTKSNGGADGVVDYAWTATDLDTAGDYEALVEVEWAAGQVETLPDLGPVRIVVHPKATA